MRCQRCKGLIVRETHSELREKNRLHVSDSEMHQLWIHRRFCRPGQSCPFSCEKTVDASRNGQEE